MTRVEIEERVGGHYRTWKAEAGTVVGGFDSELLELVPDQRLVFRWGLIGPQRREGPAFDTLPTVAFRRGPSGVSTLALVHDRLEELAAAMPHVAENVAPGWDGVLNKLAALLASGST